MNELSDFRKELEDFDVSLPVSEDLSVLKETVRIGDKVAVNRFVALPMEGCDALPDGSPDELNFRRYRRFAAGGSAVIWFEATAVMQAGRSNPKSLWLHLENIDSYKKLVDETRKSAKADAPLLILQLTHSGRYSRPDGAMKPVIVHHNPALDKAQGLSEDAPLVSDSDLDDLIESYVSAAGMALQAGFDGVDIKCCHGYLLSALLAARTREGKYGGSYANRTRFVRECVKRIRARFPELLVCMRMSAFDAQPYEYGWGVSETGEPDLAEPIKLTKELKDEGLALLSISIGNPRFDPHFGRPASTAGKANEKQTENPLIGIERFCSITSKIQKAVPGLPVVGAGFGCLREIMPYVAAGAIEAGDMSFVGQGRGMLAYPDSVNDILSKGSMQKDKCCIACSLCSAVMKKGGPVGCVVRDKEKYSMI